MKRPLTPEEIQAVADAGYDISSYDGRPVDIPDDLYGPPAKASPIGAGGRAALASAIPTAAGGAGFAGGMAATGKMLAAAPIPPPWGVATKVLGGLAAAYGASKLAAAGQQALMPQAWEEQLAAEQVSNPVATKVGHLATLPLGGLRPSISGTRNAVSGLSRLAVGAPLSVSEKQALLLAGGGAALGAGQEAVIAPLEGRPVEAAHLLEAAALGSTFNRPMRFAQKYYGFHDIPERAVDDPRRLAEMQPVGKPAKQEVARPTVASPLRQESILEAITRATSAPTEGQARTRLAKAAKTSAEAMLEAEKKGQEIVSRQDEDLLAQIEKVARARKGRNQEDEGLKGTPLQQEVEASVKGRIATRPSQDYVDTLTAEVLNTKNIKVSSDGSLVNDKGAPIKGTALLSNTVREVVFNPEKATIDTLPHEGLHYFRTELEQAAKAGETKAAKLLAQWDALSKSGYEAEQARRAAENEPLLPDFHEFVVSEQGLEFVKQQFNLLGETPRQRWWNDTKALLKTRWSKNATLDDLRRAINFRFVNEQGMGKYVGKEGPLGKVGSKGGVAGLLSRNSEDSDRYNELVNIMKTKPTTEAWQELEALKNKYGGKVPVDEPARNQPDDEGLIAHQGSEGRTPYPFTLKELTKGEKTIQEIGEKADESFAAQLEQGVSHGQLRDTEASRQYDALNDIDNPILNKRNQPEGEGLSPAGEPVGAERILLDAAKRTRTYLEWRDTAADKSDGAFYKAILDDDILRDDVMGEPRVIDALKQASLLPKAKAPETPAQPNPAVESAVKQVVKESAPAEKPAPAPKASTMLSPEEARANAARIREQLLKQADVQNKIEGNKPMPTTPDDSRRNVMEASKKYLEERKRSGRYQPEGEGLTADTSAQSIVPGLAATFDKVKRIDTEIAQAGVNWNSRKDQYWGKAQLALEDLSKLPENVVNSAIAKMDNAYRTGEELRLTPEEQRAATVWRRYMGWNVNERRAMGMEIEGREAGADENYVPHMLNDKWIDIFTSKPASPEAAHGKSIWADRVVQESEGEVSRQEAYKNISAYISAMGSTSKHYTSVEFGALRKAAGYGLPEGMRETSAQRILTRYGRRASTDMAMFRELESTPSVQAKLKLRDPATGERPPDVEGEPDFSTTKEVQNMMSWVTGSINENTIKHPFVTSFSRFVNNSIMGPATGARDAASVPVFALPYITRFSDLAAFAKGVTQYRTEARNALEYAAKQPHIDKLAFADIKDSPNRFIELVRKSASFMRAAQGREAIENFNREITFAGGKELMRNYIIGARAGHNPSKMMLKRFSTLVEGDVTTIQGAELEAALNQMAKNFTDANQGTYGGAGLPTWTAEGPLAPFLALQKWSIEKSNIIFKDVIKPFYTGENRIPLLTYTLGSVLTGVGIQELNKMLTNKKASDPTWEEALDKGDAAALTSQLATLLQLASFGGIVGDSMKVVSDAVKGKTPRNPLSFPAYSSTVDAAEQIKNAVNAINDGEDAMAVLTELSAYLMTHNIQAVRMAYNRLNPDETERTEKFRDVRVFNELEGKRGTAIPTVNRYAGLAAKQFKRTGDLEEAAVMLPSLFERLNSRAGGDYEKLSRGLTSLRGNSYQTFPDMERNPQSFQDYYEFLVRTQGQEAADKRLEDFMQQKMVNRVKTSLVPSF